MHAVPVIAALLAVGCVNPYEQPGPNSPHALVKVRLAYHDHPGPQLAERVRINDYDIVLPPDESGRATPVTEPVRVRPELAAWSISSNFYHTYTTTTMTTTTYSCGTSTCSRTTPTTMTHTVSDGSCQKSVTFLPQVGAMYLLQYDFLAANQCSLVCLQQFSAGNGQFTTEPCPIVVIAKN